jgi:hypothetical protein
MRYAIWGFSLDTNTNEKTTPLEGKGICFLDQEESQIIGYLDESADVSLLAQWLVVELDQSEALTMLQSRVEGVTVNEDGIFIFPINLPN